eukprot:TRINITY_DN10613_c0_g1_i5.p2 TRINITY_DN10613_c0_g1~~TRINITY_DN10613_c0_g1_i5.p2  ORF type:complete len:209 (+),score=27.13 TRINITY_DN10613_c0_g1_i5:121-747(+)
MNAKKVAGQLHLRVEAEDYINLRQVQERMFSAIKDKIMHPFDGDLNLHVGDDMKMINMSHYIHRLSFGPEFPGQVNPLDGFKRTSGDTPGSYKYFLTVVPTSYKRGSVMRSEVHTNQYSVHEYFYPIMKGEKGQLVGDERIPSVEFMYDMSSIEVHIRDEQYSFPQFLVKICAVVGGCFALSGMLDRYLHAILGSIQVPNNGHLKGGR